MNIKRKVLVFSVTNFSLLHGGILAAANLLENIKGAADADVTLVTSGPANAEEANRQLAASLALNHIFVPLGEVSPTRGGLTSGRIVATARNFITLVTEKYRFLYERFSFERTHLDIAFREIVDTEKPDLIIVNNIMSAVCVPSAFLNGIPCCFITHNHEVDIHRDLRLHGCPTDLHVNGMATRWIASRFNWISNTRFNNYMRRLYKRCTGIIALTDNDLPTDLPSHIVRAVLPPLLMESNLRWNYEGRRRILFVGNISYFANRLAVEWICSQLAPELLLIDNEVHINIIGANADDVCPSWRLRNITFLGQSDKEEVTRRMISDDLFISPTSQHYGAKLKLAECASHGMPFIATNTAMGGLPFLTFIPRLDLSRPTAAAHLIMKCIDNPEILNTLSREVTERMRRARTEQSMAWSSFIKELRARKTISVPAGRGG